MPLTLAQAKVGMADKVDQMVVDEFRRDSFLLDKLIFDNTVSPGTGGSTMIYGYMQLLTPSTAEGRKLNEEYKPGEALKTKKSADLKIFGGSFQVDRVLEETAAKSEIAFQLQQKTKAASNKFHYDFINADSTNKETDFDGLEKLVKGTSTEYIPSTSIDLSDETKIAANSKKFVFELDQWLGTLDGRPDMLLMNRRMKTIMSAVARELKYFTQTEDAFGRKVDNYDGIPMVDMGEYYDGSTTVPCVATDTAGETSIYAVTIGLDACHGISPKGEKIIKTYLPDMKAPGAVKTGEVEMLAGIVLKNSKKAGVFRKVKISTPVSVVKLAKDSLGIAGDKTITGLEAGKTYRVQNASTVKFTAADGTLTDEAEKAALGEGVTAIKGLTNGRIYLVEEV
ncbi:major capsid protein [Longicatena caecimuris]|uniref:major capsid protein n=1 Tax=Longicatena caecimuris TaxID=1796635 RepID=UPI0018AC4072|nr:phage capsid protein [Longicatena caecimuris]